MKRVAFVIAAVLLFGASPAWANLVNVRPGVAIGTSGETSLQQIFNNIGATGINVTTDQAATAIFTNTAGGASVATMVLELAGYANVNTFGIYSFSDPSKTLQVFSGPDGAGSSKYIEFWANGTASVVGGGSVTGFGSLFGFYVVTGGGNTFYSEDTRNPSGSAQMLAYVGEGNNVSIGNYSVGSDLGNYYLAFEDLPYRAGDHDFNDMVVSVKGITAAVPEPTSMLLLGTGLLGLAAFARRRR